MIRLLPRKWWNLPFAHQNKDQMFIDKINEIAEAVNRIIEMQDHHHISGFGSGHPTSTPVPRAKVEE